MTDASRTVTAAELTRFATDVLARSGLPEQDAAAAAAAYVDADLRGVSSHGLALLGRNVGRLKRGSARARPDIRIVRDDGPIAVLDGGAGLGPVVAVRGMRWAIEKASIHGIGAVGVRNANHFGAAGYYAAMGAEHGMIGIAASNGGSNLAPPGGTSAVVGNNPLAIAVPSERGPDLMVDMALSVVSYNRIRQAAQRGERLGAGWALDRRGDPTDDPAAALEGLLLPIGGHKGFALALALETLTGALTGGYFSSEVLARDHHGMGFFFLVLDVARFGPSEHFRSRVGDLLERVRASERRPGVERIITPGERSAEAKRRHLTEGVPVSSLPWTELERLAQDLQIPLPAQKVREAKATR